MKAAILGHCVLDVWDGLLENAVTYVVENCPQDHSLKSVTVGL